MPEFYHAKSPIPKGEGKPYIFVATPTINTHANHFASLVKAIPRLMGAGVAIDHYLLSGCVHVDDARNTCVAAFLKSEADYLVFIDADVGFPPEALYRLACHADGDIVAGVYPRKELQRSYPIRMEGEVLHTGEDGLIREGVLSVPAGFLRISRKCIEHMAEDALAKGYRSAETGENVPCLFERRTIKGQRMSGDVAFCEHARALGYPILVDPMLELSHAGEIKFHGMLAADFAGPANDEEAKPQ